MGWAGYRFFVLPGKESARTFARELSEYGFPSVGVNPRQGGGWVVTALDEGPYDNTTTGQRTMDAVARAAGRMARAYGGYADGGAQFDVTMLPQFRQEQDGQEIVHRNPGARPPRPTIVLKPTPPPANLPLRPDTVIGGRLTTADIDAVDWSSLRHAHGAADDVPGLMHALVRNGDDWSDVLGELVGDDVLHQGTCYSATAPAVALLAQLPALSVSQRIELYRTLLWATDRWADSLIGRADRAAVAGRLPQPAAWTAEVHVAVGRQLPALLDRWTAEPAAARYWLACLAGQYPHHGSAILPQIELMAAECAGTQAGAYLDLAVALLRADDGRALAVAEDITTWDEASDPGWLDAPGITPSLRCAHVLAEGSPG
ncbi:hypothetical protein [Kutzneria chonburiensis]|uniref:Uncharacterized protein n=1 Tax=Kutzneria chonburiensis TaxID=1483604 RepID=A0ABV6MPU4_9PSEU|nr:hypothetical protein [Kutzneria chonburiensis]